MSAEQAVMRTTLLPGLLAAVAANLAHQAERVAVFEQGRVYLPRRDGALPTPRRGPRTPASRGRPTSPRCSASRSAARSWARAGRATARPTDFYTIKGFVERLLAGLQIGGAALRTRRPSPTCTPARRPTLLLDDERVGALGLLRPDVAARYGIEGHAVYVAELAVAPLAARGLTTSLFEDLLTFPPASQDLAVVLDAGVPAAEVLAVVRKAGGKLLREAHVFDVYEGDQVPAGKRSLAVRLLMRSPDRTLTEKDITGVRHKVLSALERDLGAALR